MPIINMNGRNLHYDEKGDKDADFTLLFIHGASGSLDVWAEETITLNGCRSIALDLPGHGQSDPPGRRTVAHYAVIVEEFIGSLRIKRPILVGHSMGSAIALTIAHRKLVSLCGLVLMGGSARMPVGAPILSGALTDLEGLATFVAEHGAVHITDEWREVIRRQVMATGGMTTYGDYLACNRFDLRLHLSDINVPTLFISGRQDSLVPLRFSESTAAAMPRARIAILEDTGHFVMLERPQAIRQLILGFLHGPQLATR